MKYLKSINEYGRAIGFKSAKPNIRYNVMIFCKGELDEDQFSALLKHLDIPYENLVISTESKEIDLDGVVIETDLKVEFDVLSYSQSEMEYFSEEIQSGLNRELDVQSFEFYFRLAPVLNLRK